MTMAMTEQEITTTLADIVEEFMGLSADEVQPDAHLIDDLGIDSLSMVEIILSVRDRLGVDIPDEDLAGLQTVRDVVGYVRRSLVSA
jgi:acyl carrier protein